MGEQVWITIVGLALTYTVIIVGAVRYFDGQISSIEKKLADKLSIGEYNRRHEDLEKRMRAAERWQDHANGRYRHEYHADEH